jgi:hypothetical protein
LRSFESFCAISGPFQQLRHLRAPYSKPADARTKTSANHRLLPSRARILRGDVLGFELSHLSCVSGFNAKRWLMVRSEREDENAGNLNDFPKCQVHFQPAFPVRISGPHFRPAGASTEPQS